MLSENQTLTMSLPAFLRQRLADVLQPRACRILHKYLLLLIAAGRRPPLKVGGPDWRQISAESGVPLSVLKSAGSALRPLFELVSREMGPGAMEGGLMSAHEPLQSVHKQRKPRRKSRVERSHTVPEFPEAISDIWEETGKFHEALSLHMERHQESNRRLSRALSRHKDAPDVRTISCWRRGLKCPRTVQSLKSLALIEKRYRLPEGYFKSKLPHQSRSATGHQLKSVPAAERRRLAWHLPDDFDERPAAERAEILDWVRKIVVSGATEYRLYQAKAMKQRYAVQFPGFSSCSRMYRSAPLDPETGLSAGQDNEVSRTIPAPPGLVQEMNSLIEFKTSILTAAGFQRVGVWGEATADQKVEHLGLLFGALVAPPGSAVAGLGVHPQRLGFGLLVFPAVWDWYLSWRVKRRGFYTSWEADMLRVGSAMTRRETGWIRQNPVLAEKLLPIRGLATASEISRAKANWDDACEAVHGHLNSRTREIQRVARVHRDPFEAILPVLEAEKPLAEYRKIADEVRNRIPDERMFPLAAAEAVRSYLILRLGMHLGIRQKNLRQLLFAERGMPSRTERQLTDRLCGELRWHERDGGWEVVIPAAAFKNASSSYFGNKPFRLLLPDLDGLYGAIDAYLARHRTRLLRHAADPRTFFVKTVKTSSRSAAYDQNTFYEAWRLIIQRYGVFNPYTGRGAIKGLLPHGPHNIRDVLATHILKCTGSYEQASYAIQDTPDMVAKHYGRFLPRDKAAIAAQVLNKVWETP